MRLRRYVGPDLPTVLRKIRHELGEDAVIVSTRERVEGGLLGFFGTRVVEVLVALNMGASCGEGRGLDLSIPGELPQSTGGVGDEKTPISGNVVDEGAGKAGFHWGEMGCFDKRNFLPLGITCSEGDFPRRALFFGPPGSGKTSSLGRLAWYFGDQERVLVISVEEEGRLSGTSRWRAFWDILGVEYLPVMGMDGLRDAVTDGFDALLVDTPPLHQGLVEELEDISRQMFLVPFLTVDATMDLEEFRSLRKLCRKLEGLRVVVCKTDMVTTLTGRSKWEDELRDVQAYFSDHPSINIPLKPLVMIDRGLCEERESRTLRENGEAYGLGFSDERLSGFAIPARHGNRS